MSDKTTERLVRELTTILSMYENADNEDERTPLLKRAARVVVELRSRFTLEDGRTDWSGRSRDYRETIRTAYDHAYIPRERRDTIQTALRYHVGNLVRQRVNEEDLEAVGLSRVAPKDRLSRNREIAYAIAASAGGQRAAQNPIKATAYAVALMEAVSPDHIEAMPMGQANALRVGLDRLWKETERVFNLLPAEARERPKAARRPKTRG